MSLLIIYILGVVIVSFFRARAEDGKRFAEGPFARGFEAAIWPVWVPLWAIGAFGEVIWGLMRK